MLQHITPTILLADRDAAEQGIDAALRHLRRISLADFGELMLGMPNPDFPALSRVLPSMASVEVQQNWTGGSGMSLLQDSTTFIRILQSHFEALCRRPLRGAQVLDYGCGYGRLMRLMYYFCNPATLFGVDPALESIEVCTKDGILGHLALSGYLPTSLPVEGVKFDLIYSYSVFTHLSLKATSLALNTLRQYMRNDGMLVITIRPIEYWEWHHSLPPGVPDQMREAHQSKKFAFFRLMGLQFKTTLHAARHRLNRLGFKRTFLSGKSAHLTVGSTARKLLWF